MNDKLSKANFKIDGNHINVTMPFAKIDEEKRLVSGFATLDNVDKQGDIVDSKASIAAFSNTQARIREMHAPVAVGKIMSFEPQDYYDQSTGKTYKGVYVTAYVSKGAPDTWEKVLDGTLSGFSIGGNILKKEFIKHADSPKPVQYISEYTLSELSLVDNPANQYAMIASIQKNAEGEEFIKMAVDLEPLENVFYCNKDEIAVSSTDETKSCINCDQPMENIGWFERAGDEETTTKFATIVNKYTSNLQNNNDDGNIITKQEGGNNMSEANNEVTEDKVEEVQDPATDNGRVDDVDEAVEATEVEEVADADLNKMFSDFEKAVIEAVNKNSKTSTDEITAIREEVAGLVKSFEDKFEDINKTVAAIDEKFDTLNKSFEAVEGRVDKVEKGTAVKKSGDLGGEPEESFTKNDSPWRGSFFDVTQH